MNNIERLTSYLSDTNCILIENPVNIRYFTGMYVSNGMIIVTKNAASFFTDSRYITAAKCQVDSFFEVFLLKNTHSGTLKEYLPKNINEVLFEAQYLSYATAIEFFESIPELSFSSADELLLKLRSVKSEEELSFMKKAQEIADLGFLFICEFIKSNWKSSISEKQIALELEIYMRKKGSEKMPFSIICASGKNTALPHAVPCEKLIESGDFITLDYGASVNGYASDMTRTVCVEKVSEKQEFIYNLVLDAQTNSLKSIKAGVMGSYIHKIAKQTFDEENLGGYFGHALGHSLGLDVHEYPYFSLSCNDLIPENAVLSVEPGLYIPGEFGVRIEDCVIIKENGYENITKSKKSLIIL